jgi:hypothetical protein
MPFGTTLAIIASIAGLAGTGISVGETLANRPSAPKTPPATPATPATQTPAQQSQQLATERGIISQQLPNILSETSGLANPGYVEQVATLLSGQGGAPGSTGAAQQAVNSAFGFNQLPGTPKSFTPAGAGGSSGTNPVGADTGLSDFVKGFLS